MPISNFASLKPDFQTGLITDSSPEVGLSRAHNILFLTEGITRVPFFGDVSPLTGDTRLEAADAFIRARTNNNWWSMRKGKIYFNADTNQQKIIYPSSITDGSDPPYFEDSIAPRIQFWSDWIIFSAKNKKVLALTYKVRGTKTNTTFRFEYLDPNDDPANEETALKPDLPSNYLYQSTQALGAVNDILIGQNFAYACGSGQNNNIWRWSRQGDISNWTTIDKNGVPLITADSAGYLPIRNATSLNAQIIFRSNLYIFGDNEIYRISRTNEVDPVTKVPILFKASLIVEGMGCKGRNALVATRHGIFFADKAGIFIFNGNDVLNISRGKIQSTYLEFFQDITKVYSVHWSYLNTIVFFYENIGLAFNYNTNAWSELSFGINCQFENYISINRDIEINQDLIGTMQPKNSVKELIYNEDATSRDASDVVINERSIFGDSPFGISPFGGAKSKEPNEKNIVVHEAYFETHNKTFGSEVSKNLRYIRSVGGIAIYEAKTENSEDYVSGEDYLLTGKVYRVRGNLRTFSLTDTILIGLVKATGRFSNTETNYSL